MPFRDDDLSQFETDGAPALPAADVAGQVAHDGVRIWHAAWGDGPAVVLLHGGLGHGGNLARCRCSPFGSPRK